MSVEVGEGKGRNSGEGGGGNSGGGGGGGKLSGGGGGPGEGGGGNGCASVTVLHARAAVMIMHRFIMGETPSSLPSLRHFGQH